MVKGRDVMAWYPEARKLELQPESDSQVAIVPTQFIMHSIAAPWTAQRIYEYWRDSTNLESHFGLGYAGDLGQYIGTETRADANYQANLRPDGSGAVSIETASNLEHTDAWTSEQVEQLIRLGVWLHQTHGIPLRVCQAPDDPGYGYHRMYADWSLGGTDCPGDARVSQFHDVVFPQIAARVTGVPSTPPASEEDDLMGQMLNSPNAIDVDLTSGAWTPLAFGTERPNGPAVLHGAGIRHDTKVHLLFDETLTDPETRITGRYYLVDPDGLTGKSHFLQEDFKGGGGHVFQCASDVPAGKYLRFEIRAVSPGGTPVKLLHRLATGPYRVL